MGCLCGPLGCDRGRNGTDAIELALRAPKIGPGVVVLTTSKTAVATVAAIDPCLWLRERYVREHAGMNRRLDAIQAAVLRVSCGI